MQEAVPPPLAIWQTFYTIIGSAAARLPGLMFVVITLIAGTRLRRSSEPQEWLINSERLESNCRFACGEKE